jgi:hypothetical protein
MMEANILASIELADVEGVVDLPKRQADISVRYRRSGIALVAAGFFPAERFHEKCGRVFQRVHREAQMIDAASLRHGKLL